MKEIQEQLPKIVSETVDRYMNSKSVEVKVDEYSMIAVIIRVCIVSFFAGEIAPMLALLT